jgi:hypothetical protein
MELSAPLSQLEAESAAKNMLAWVIGDALIIDILANAI